MLTANDALRPDPKLDKVAVTLPRPYANHNWPEPGGYSTNAMYHLEASGPLQQIWTQDAGKGSDSSSRLTAPPVIDDGRIYVLDSEAHVFAFNAATGAPLWDKELAPKGHQSLTNELSLGMFGTNTSIDPSKGFGGGVATEGDRIFVTTGFGDVIALDAKTGKRIWTHNVGVPIINAPVANGGRVFVSSVDNHFHAFAATDGHDLWDQQGISEIGLDPGEHQRGGGRRICDRALHLGRALCDPRHQWPCRLVRYADALGRRHRPVRTR